MRKTKKVLKDRLSVNQNANPVHFCSLFAGAARKKGRKSKKLNRTQKQHAGAGQITDTNLITNILAKVNSDTVLIGNITTALQQKEKPSIATLQQAYTSVANGSRLFDLIYDSQALTTYDTAKQPSLIWDHGINNPKSITAGKLGTHIYIYKDNTSSLFKLLGVIYKKDKMSAFNKASDLLTFFGV